MPRSPFRLAISSWLSILYTYPLPRFPTSAHRPCLPFRLDRAKQSSAPQLLYDLEKAYFNGLNKLLRNNNYVKQLVDHPENEISELVDYLNDVCLRSTK